MPDPQHDDLHHLFHTAPVPDLAIDPRSVLDGGQRRVQRRRRMIGGALSGATALAVVGAVVSTGLPAIGREEGDPSPAVSPTLPLIPLPDQACPGGTEGTALDGPLDAPGTATPYAAARSLHITGLDASGPWRETERTASSARLYREGTWVKTVRTKKGGWVVNGWTRCSGAHHEPPLADPLPEAAHAVSAGLGEWAVTLDGDPLWPDVGTRRGDGAQAQRATADPSVRLPGIDLRAYRTPQHTVLLAPLGTDRSLHLHLASPAADDAAGTDVEVGGVRYAVLLAPAGTTAKDVAGAYRTLADGSMLAADGERPVAARFTSSMARVDWFARSRYGVLTSSGTSAAVTVDEPSWGRLALFAGIGAGDETMWTAGLLPPGSHDVQLDAGSGTLHRTTADGHVVVLLQTPVPAGASMATPGPLRWTDPKGIRWQLPYNGAPSRVLDTRGGSGSAAG